MLVGHYAPAFVIKSVDKTIPLWLLFLAVQIIDIVWAFLVLIGIEKIRIVPGITASNPLDLYYFPFSHSLLAALFWSVIAFVEYRFLPFFRGTRRAALWVGAGVLFHWILDLLVHRPDLPLFGDIYKVGLGLWDRPIAALALEAGIAIAGILLYLRSTTAASVGGKYGMLLFGIIMLLFQIGTSYGPPPPSSQAVAITMLAFYFCTAGIVFWLEKKRQ